MYCRKREGSGRRSMRYNINHCLINTDATFTETKEARGLNGFDEGKKKTSEGD